MKKTKLGILLKKIKTGKLDANASCENGKYPFFTCAVEPLKIDSYSYDCECVLVAGNGDLNVKYYKGKFDAYQRTYILEVSNTNVLNTRYFYYFMKNYLDVLRTRTKGGIIKYIRLNDIADAEIPLPPMEEQKKIAARLDTVSDLLAKQKQLLAEQDTLIQSLFYDMFGDLKINSNSYHLCKFEDLFSRIKNGANIKQEKEKKEGYPITRIETIWNREIDRKRMGYADIYDHKKYNDYILLDNDILISHINSVNHIGKSALYRKHNDEIIIHGMNLLCARPIIQKINPVFIFCFFKTTLFKEMILSITKPAVNQASFTVSDFKRLSIPVPPLELQEKFAAIVEQIETEKSKIKSAIAETQTLFNALMAEYFEE